jgi:hypothetical protein
MFQLIKRIMLRYDPRYINNISMSIWIYLGEEYLIITGMGRLPVYWEMKMVPRIVSIFIENAEESFIKSPGRYNFGMLCVSFIEETLITYYSTSCNPSSHNYDWRFIQDFHRENRVMDRSTSDIFELIDENKKMNEIKDKQNTETMFKVIPIIHIIDNIVSYTYSNSAEIEFRRREAINNFTEVMIERGIIPKPIDLQTKIIVKTKMYQLEIGSGEVIYFETFKYDKHQWLSFDDYANGFYGTLRFSKHSSMWSSGEINDLRRSFERVMCYIKPVNMNGYMPSIRNYHHYVRVS